MTRPEQLDRIGARIYASDNYPDAETDGPPLPSRSSLATSQKSTYTHGRQITSNVYLTGQASTLSPVW